MIVGIFIIIIYILIIHFSKGDISDSDFKSLDEDNSISNNEENFES